jgi:arginase family enzyme
MRRRPHAVYLHVDLDVLDPSEFTSVCYSSPDGPSVQRVLDLIAQVGGDVVRRIAAAIIARVS